MYKKDLTQFFNHKKSVKIQSFTKTGKINIIQIWGVLPCRQKIKYDS